MSTNISVPSIKEETTELFEVQTNKIDGTINDIAEIVKENNLSSPAIIIIGDVVSEASNTTELSQKIEMYLAS